MKIRRRLLLAQLVPLVPLLLTGLVTVAALWTMSRSVQEAQLVQVARIHTAKEAIDAFREQYASMERYVETGDTAWLTEARARGESVRARIPAISAIQSSKELEAMLDAYEDAAGLRDAPLDAPAARTHARDVVAELVEREEELREQLRDDLAGVAKTGRSTGTAVILVVGLVLVAGTGISLVVSRDLSEQVRELERGTTALSAGDFGYRIETRGDDEFTQLAGAFNRMAQRIAALDRMKADFYADISHDLKTPLTSMSEAVALLDEEIAGPLSDDQRALVDILGNDVSRLRSLVANVLDLSRLGSQQADLTPGDVRASIERVCGERRPTAERQGVRIRIGCEADLPEVVINSGMVEQVLQNLVGNAVKFSPPRSSVLVSAVRSTKEGMLLNSTRPSVLVTVTDQGPGVPAAYRERVFERFFQVPAQGEGKGGTGLGLYICHEIVSTHGGRIWVEEAPGGGSTFCFTLAEATPGASGGGDSWA